MVHQGTGDVEEISPGCWVLKLPLPFPVEVVNCYLIEGNGEACLVDCGLHTSKALAHFQAALRMIGIAPGDISTIVVTHYHPDHLGMAGTIQSMTGARIVMSSSEYEMLGHNWYDPGSNADRAIHQMLEQSGMPRSLIARLHAQRVRLGSHIDPVQEVTAVNEGDAIIVGRRRLQAIITPGHSPGHLCLFEAETGLFWVGDHLLPRITPNIGLFPLSNPQPLGSYLTSLEKVSQLPVKLAFPAHGEPFEDVRGRVEELILHHQRRLHTLLSLMTRRGSTPYTLSQKLFGKNLPDQARRFALAETLAHLEHLVAEGQAEKAQENGLVRYRNVAAAGRERRIAGRANS
ncbi:MAG: MBL fold metallo-hydrolase [Candidatus Tectomicrobia bacterium]|uniref:MBL fold metallo-hydrolase n=1 Tax=Tectimicrobiota bacterium TaxID=2528274 RepID=A0A932GP56_UNCTE|nr:MBL fold metallo-hydrolase [Candidatus Tectomicrobia bacterium]